MTTTRAKTRSSASTGASTTTSTTTASKPVRAAIYCRISQDRAGAGLGVGRQEEDCRDLARRHGWTVTGVYADNDISAYSGKVRPRYRDLIADVRAGAVDVVLAWHTDRLHRSPLELEEWISTCEKRGVSTHTVQSGEIDLATPTGKVHARMLGSFARYESDIKGERVRRRSREKAMNGEWLGGRIPLGWKKRVKDGEVVLDRVAARRIRKACEDLLAGASLGSIVKQWNADGFTTANGRPWSYQTLRQVLRRPRNCGRIEFRGEFVAESPWPSIVDEDTWRSVVKMLADPARRKSQSNRAKWLVSGIAVCGECGTALKSATISNRSGRRPKPVTYYRCPTPGRGHVARRAEYVDEQVLITLGEWFTREDLGGLLVARRADGVAGEQGEDAADLRAEAVALRGRLTDLAESFADGLLSRAQLEAASARVNLRLVEIEAALSASAVSSAASALIASPSPAKALWDAPIDRQRAIIRELVTVTILRKPDGAPREYDPRLTVIEPRR